jgi:hypothetical protein
MKYEYNKYTCEHCGAKVKRRKPLTHQFSMPCPKCHKASHYFIDHNGNERLRPPLLSKAEIEERLAKLGMLKNPERYGHWKWISKMHWKWISKRRGQ